MKSQKSKVKSQNYNSKFKNLKFKFAALFIIGSVILSNFVFAFEAYAFAHGSNDGTPSHGPGDPDYTPPAPLPGDPGFIGPVLPGCSLNVGSILAGAGGILTSAGSAIYKAGEWLDTTILGPKDARETVDAGTPIPGGDGGTMSALMGGDGGIGSALGLISGGGLNPDEIFGGLSGSEVPVQDKEVRSDTRSQTIKEKCLDGMAWMAARFFIRKITDDLVRWIRNGANGKPRFIQNLGDYLKETADIAGGLVFEKILGKENSKMLCEPWRAQIALDVFLPKRDNFKFKAQCKVSEIINRATNASVNIDIDVERDRGIHSFYNDFSKGGWPAFLTMATDDGSNAIGSYLMTLSEKRRREAEAVENAKNKAIIDKGMLPEICVKTTGITGSITIPGAKQKKDASGKTINEVCSKSKSFTPGAVIEETLANNVWSDLRQLELADELNEIIAATIDAIRMKRFWEDGIAGRGDDTEDGTEGSSMLGWTFDGEERSLNIQVPRLLNPENKAAVSHPLKFDWTNAIIEDTEIGSYLVRVIFPDRITEKNMLTPCQNGIPASASECELSEEEFNALDRGGTYIWQVTAFDKNGNLAGLELGTNAGGVSEPGKFVMPRPNLKGPKQGKISTKKISFEWSSFKTEQETNYYELLLTAPDGQEKTIRVDSGTSFIISEDEFGTLKNGEYNWKVGAFDAEGNLIGRYSKIGTFTVFGKPILENPAEGAMIAFPYTFDWQDAQFATSYEIRIKKKDGNFRKFDSDESQITINNDNWKNPDGDFVWQVRALIETGEEVTDDEGNVSIENPTTATSAWSEEREFTATTAAP